MASGKTKYDPLEAAKLGTDQPPTPAAEAFTTPTAAVTAPRESTDDAPPPQRRPRFKLLADKRCSLSGQLISFKAGRIFDSAGYNIDNLRAQGCELELVQE